MEPIREGRHLAAIMFVDMVGYSARMQQNEPAAIAAVRALWDRVRPILAEHGGREVDLAGDGMLMEFPGAFAAVKTALAIHVALRESNKALPENERTLTRAGVHLGDIEHKDGRIYGDGVNIAARILAIAPPGGIAMSPHVRDQIHNVLDRPLEPLGRKALKNIKAPMELWCLRGPDCSAADLAAARAASAESAASRRWSFENVTFDERTLELCVDGTPVEVEKKSLDALTALLARAGEVVTKDELLEAVWPGRVLSESALTTAMAKLRAALRDDDQRLIRTVHGFGYRLAAGVKVDTQGEAPAAHFDFKEGDALPARPHWQLVRRLGQGGQGEAWLARHDKTGEERVYKFALDAKHLASLKREITLSRVLAEAHAGKECFARILDWNLDTAPYFVESQYARGGSLLDWAAAQGGLSNVPLATRLELAAQAAEALGLAHSVGVLHKDLKPANLLVDDTQGAPKVKLSDFGSGGVLDPDRLAEMGITRMGFTRLVLDDSSAATPMYLAPEVVAGQPFTSRADVYALGVMLYQIVTGDFSHTLAPGWEREVADELLREDIAAAAAGDPLQRLSDAAEVARRLRSLEARRAQLAEQARLREKAATQQKQIERYRYRRWWTASVTVLLTLTAFYGVFMETDYGKALFLSYSEMWDSADRLEKAGNLPEAERLLRQIIVAEENRVTMKIGLFVLFAGPDYLVSAKLKLARLYWQRGRLHDAEEVYRDTLAKIDDLSGSLSWTYPLAELRYSEFLAATKQEAAAREHLVSAKARADAIVDKTYWPWQDYEGSHRGFIKLEVVPKIEALLAQLDRPAAPPSQ